MMRPSSRTHDGLRNIDRDADARARVLLARRYGKGWRAMMPRLLALGLPLNRTVGAAWGRGGFVLTNDEARMIGAWIIAGCIPLHGDRQQVRMARSNPARYVSANVWSKMDEAGLCRQCGAPLPDSRPVRRKTCSRKCSAQYATRLNRRWAQKNRAEEGGNRLAYFDMIERMAE